MGALAPFIAADLGLNRAQVGMMGSMINFGILFTALVMGRAADLWGERLVLTIGGLMAGLSIMVASRAGSFSTLIALLLFTGLWVAASTPAGGKAILSWFPVKQSGFALGIRQTGIPLGGALSALMLPSLAAAYGWREAMVAGGFIAIFGALVCFTAYRDSPALSRAERLTPSPNEELPPSRVRGLTPARAEEKERSRPSYEPVGSLSDVLRIPAIWLASLAGVTLVGVQFTMVNHLEVFLNERLSISIRTASYFLVAFQLAGVIGRIILGTVSDTLFRGARKPVMLIASVMTIGTSLAMLRLTPVTPLWVLAVVSWFAGFSAAGWNGIYVALVSELVGKDRAGTALGVGITLLQLGTLAIPTMFGYLADRTGSYGDSWVFLAFLVFLGAVLLTFVREKPKLWPSA